MKLISEELKQRIKNKKPISLDLGCGVQPKPGCFGVDHIEMEGVDVIADLNSTLELIPSNIVEYIYSSHVLEHIKDIIGIMSEIHRISTNDAIIEITVPHFSDVFGYSDPTHVRLFGIHSFFYFSPLEHQPTCRKVPDFYSSAKFLVESIKIDFYKRSYIEWLVAPLMHRLVNINLATQMFYERRLSRLWHAAQIHFVLRPIK